MIKINEALANIAREAISDSSDSISIGVAIRKAKAAHDYWCFIYVIIGIFSISSLWVLAIVAGLFK